MPSGIYDGAVFPATVLIAGTDGVAKTSLDGITPTVAYYTGPTATGTSSTSAPKNANTYTVEATFLGDTTYSSTKTDAPDVHY